MRSSLQITAVHNESLFDPVLIIGEMFYSSLDLIICTLYNVQRRKKGKTCQRSWVFATISVFVKPISLQPYDENLWYFKLTLFDLTEFIVWNIKGLRNWIAIILKLENQSLWQKLNSFRGVKGVGGG